MKALINNCRDSLIFSYVEDCKRIPKLEAVRLTSSTLQIFS